MSNVVDLFLWRELRANQRATAAQAEARRRPEDGEAARDAYDAMADYVRAARQRNEAERRRREREAQAFADRCKEGRDGQGRW